jgi:hypothetical protein
MPQAGLIDEDWTLIELLLATRSALGYPITTIRYHGAFGPRVGDIHMMRVCGREGEILLHPSPKGSVKRRAPDLSKLKRLTGFEEQIDLDSGLQACADFYLDGVLHGPLNPPEGSTV